MFSRSSKHERDPELESERVWHFVPSFTAAKAGQVISYHVGHAEMSDERGSRDTMAHAPKHPLGCARMT